MLAVDEVVDDSVRNRFDQPSIVVDEDCQPRILTHYQWGHRDTGGEWTVETAPAGFRTGGLDFDAATGQVWAFVSEALETNVHAWDGEDWSAQGQAHTYRGVSAAGVLPTGDDRARLLLSDSMASLERADLDGGVWTYPDSILVGAFPVLPHLRGDPDAPQVSYRYDFFSGNPTEWAGPGIEVAVDSSGWWPDWTWIPSARDTALQHALAVDDADVPHVLSLRSAGDGLLETVLARRDAANDWALYSVATDEGTVCLAEDYSADETCDYDYVETRPLALVAAGAGEVLAFIAVAHRVGTVQAAGAGTLYWTELSDTSDYELHLAWLEEDAITTTTLLTDRRIERLSTFLDDDGRIHLAALEGPHDQTIATYLRLDP